MLKETFKMNKKLMRRVAAGLLLLILTATAGFITHDLTAFIFILLMVVASAIPNYRQNGKETYYVRQEIKTEQ